MDHPAVAAALAFACPDHRLGEEVGAAVVLNEGASASERELREFASLRLADFKVPRRIFFVDEIPKGPDRQTAADWTGLEARARARTR